ncbi:hypothetical protein G7Z17_g4069 [Cylindrodendrum hubeiense]|uniref:Uncharacterized protein n=1 Tax=Cylindrodendrum hubeiense TaxID=595255 RepID=A0A9P5H9I7_9HYPO|nr:hypothetical protein G7Z17_g4069 [Cylindrodendrum hubeiense]
MEHLVPKRQPRRNLAGLPLFSTFAELRAPTVMTEGEIEAPAALRGPLTLISDPSSAPAGGDDDMSKGKDPRLSKYQVYYSEGSEDAQFFGFIKDMRLPKWRNTEDAESSTPRV